MRRALQSKLDLIGVEQTLPKWDRRQNHRSQNREQKLPQSKRSGRCIAKHALKTGLTGAGRCLFRGRHHAGNVYETLETFDIRGQVGAKALFRGELVWSHIFEGRVQHMVWSWGTRRLTRVDFGP